MSSVAQKFTHYTIKPNYLERSLLRRESYNEMLPFIFDFVLVHKTIRNDWSKFCTKYNFLNIFLCSMLKVIRVYLYKNSCYQGFYENEFIYMLYKRGKLHQHQIMFIGTCLTTSYETLYKVTSENSVFFNMLSSLDCVRDLGDVGYKLNSFIVKM